ncbi:hypothetical protein AB7M67_006063 [Bradyrhizobium japonicum]
MGDRLLHVLYGDQADAAILLVDHEQLLDAMLVQHPPRLVLADILADRDEAVMRHQFGDFLPAVGGKPHVAVGEDADQLAGRILVRTGDDGNAGDAVVAHQLERIVERGLGADGERVHHHARLVALDLPDLGGLPLGIEIAVDDAEAAGLRHGDRHAGFGDRVHGGGHDRDVERNGAGDAGADVDLARHDVRQARLQQHVVERKGFANALKLHRGHLPTPSCGPAANSYG